MGPGFCSELVLLRAGTLTLESLVAFTVLVALVGLERLAELVVSMRNAAWSRARGGVETGRGHYPFMVVLHTGLLVGALVEAWVRRPEVPAWLAWSMTAAGAGLAGAALVVHRHPRPALEHPRDRGAGAGAGHGRALPVAAPPQLRRGGRRGHRAAAGARRAGSPRWSSRCSTPRCSPSGSGSRTQALATLPRATDGRADRRCVTSWWPAVARSAWPPRCTPPAPASTSSCASRGRRPSTRRAVRG